MTLLLQILGRCRGGCSCQCWFQWVTSVDWLFCYCYTRSNCVEYRSKVLPNTHWLVVAVYMPRCGGLSSKCSLSTSQHQFKYPNIRVCRISTPWLALFWGPVFDPSFFFQTLNFGIIFVSSKCNSEDVERSYSVGPFLIGVQKRYQKKTFSKHIFFRFSYLSVMAVIIFSWKVIHG